MMSVKLNRQTFENLTDSVLYSYTMVFFSKNKILGILLFVVCFFDVKAGLAGLLATIVSNIFAYLIGLDHKKIASGLYGFNALLTGLAIGFAFQPSPLFYILLIFIALTSLLITISLEGILLKYSLSYLTIPFLITTWLVILSTRTYTSLTPGESGIFLINTLYQRGGTVMVDLNDWFNSIDLPVYIITYFKSLGAIFFQYHLFAGIIIAIGLLIYSRIAFLYSIIGFTSAWVFYLSIGADIHELDYSYVGFNNILTAIGIGCFFTIASRWSLLWTVLVTPAVSMLISAGIQLLDIYQLPVYSLPFNVVVLLFIYALKFRQTRFEKPALTYIQHFSPEKNLYSSQNSIQRSINQQSLPISLPFSGYRFVSQAHDGEYTHKENWKHAWDFVIRDGKGNEFERDGSSLFDYYTYNKPVLSPADGWIQEVIDHVEDNQPGDINLDQNWGNTIIIKHADRLFSKLSHLKQYSILYPKGTFVQKGQVIALSGNSGRSPIPHLHFQIQENPFIGSHTIKYPLSQYVKYNGKDELVLSGYPALGDQIADIQSDSLLINAFKFTPGRIIQYEFDGIRGEWQVVADIYNNVSIRCIATNSIAWLKTDGNIFYFTHFEGKQKSALYYLFMSAFKVPLGYYADIVLQDIYSPSILKSSFLIWAQDFIAPFYLFIKPKYKFKFITRDEDKSTISLSTSSFFTLFKRKFINIESQILISDIGIKEISIKDNGLKHIILFFKAN